MAEKPSQIKKELSVLHSSWLFKGGNSDEILGHWSHSVPGSPQLCPWFWCDLGRVIDSVAHGRDPYPACGTIWWLNEQDNAYKSP